MKGGIVLESNLAGIHRGDAMSGFVRLGAWFSFLYLCRLPTAALPKEITGLV